jgi:hypothetical protein
MKAKKLLEELKAIVEAGDDPDIVVIAEIDFAKETKYSKLAEIDLLFEESAEVIYFFAKKISNP